MKLQHFYFKRKQQAWELEERMVQQSLLAEMARTNESLERNLRTKTKQSTVTTSEVRISEQPNAEVMEAYH